MKTLTLILLFVALAAPCHAANNTSPLVGKWKLDPDRSNDPSSWRNIELTIATQNDTITLTRKFTTGNRSAEEVIALDMTKEKNVVPVAWWPDNRYIGVYIGGDKTRTIHAEWVDNKNVLRLNSHLTLTTQQGDTPVTILSDYKISPDGTELILVELRSSRTFPMVYVFKKMQP